MYIFKKIADLQLFLTKERKKGLKVGFVPTMGALHQGHLSLIEKAKTGANLTVCSIFVNPTQFNETADLEKYPVTTEADIQLLNGVKTDVLFLPGVEEIYPKNFDSALALDFSPLDEVLEGEFRPGHFKGMAQVVKRLLDIVQPDQLYMGQKDFQQVCIVRSMLKKLGLAIDLVMCPIIREPDGLAMSSRNRRLKPELRKKAVLLNQTLEVVKAEITHKSPEELNSWALSEFQQPEMRAEYFKIVAGNNLETISNFDDSDYVVACTAVWLGEIRLIDNIILKSPAGL